MWDVKNQRTLMKLRRAQHPSVRQVVALIDECSGGLEHEAVFIRSLSKDKQRRDQRAVCFASRAARRPVPLRRRPFQFANRALVTSEHPHCAATAVGFRLLLDDGGP